MGFATGKTMKKSSFDSGNGAQAAKPTHDQIAALAYNLYLDRGSQPGHEKDDWYYAEQLLTGQINLESASRRAATSEPRSRQQRSRAAVGSM
jgi:hypothetical protein